jgi:glutathione synthase/RimK-type ligase-like ATP-grasp enzyme
MSREPRVVVATCRAFPHLDGDGPLLLQTLAGAGVTADVRSWDDATVPWAELDLVLVRSTWDYTSRRGEFVAWAQGCRTSNPPDVLRWNTDKTYLQELATRGVPVVPTTYLRPGEPLPSPQRHGGDIAGDLVVKPAVSASAVDTGRFAPGSASAAALVAQLHAQGRTVMVQPYLDAIEAGGETSLIYLGGAFSHAVTKRALLADRGLAAGSHGDTVLSEVTDAAPTTAQLAVAEAALAAAPGGADRLTYARVDLVPGADGAPLLLELELTEPVIFLGHAPDDALRRFAASVVAAAQATTG